MIAINNDIHHIGIPIIIASLARFNVERSTNHAHKAKSALKSSTKDTKENKNHLPLQNFFEASHGTNLTSSYPMRLQEPSLVNFSIQTAGIVPNASRYELIGIWQMSRMAGVLSRGGLR